MVDSMTLHDALAEAATGDVWLFRGRSTADRAIRFVTNSPVNHVGVVLALDDLPPRVLVRTCRHAPSAWSSDFSAFAPETIADLAGAEFGEGFFDEGEVLATGFHVLCGEGPGGIGFLFPV